jgi:hypothetical protein
MDGGSWTSQNLTQVEAHQEKDFYKSGYTKQQEKGALSFEMGLSACGLRMWNSYSEGKVCENKAVNIYLRPSGILRSILW